MNNPDDWLLGTCTSSTTSSTGVSTLTVDDIKKATAAVNSLPLEPFKEWMIESGGNPDDGWVLLVPKAEFPSEYLPSYVIRSRLVHKPTLIKLDKAYVNSLPYSPYYCGE